MNGNNVIYFDRFGVEHIPKEIRNYEETKISENIYRIQAYDSILYGYFCIRFIDFMLKVKVRLYNLYKSRNLHFANLFSRNNY